MKFVVASSRIQLTAYADFRRRLVSDEMQNRRRAAQQTQAQEAERIAATTRIYIWFIFEREI